MKSKIKVIKRISRKIVIPRGKVKPSKKVYDRKSLRKPKPEDG